MSNRSMNIIIEETSVPEHWQMCCSEWLELSKRCKSPDLDAAMDGTLAAFRYGFALGMRYQKRK